jgi:hypothetical protein
VPTVLTKWRRLRSRRVLFGPVLHRQWVHRNMRLLLARGGVLPEQQ